VLGRRAGDGDVGAVAAVQLQRLDGVTGLGLVDKHVSLSTVTRIAPTTDRHADRMRVASFSAHPATRRRATRNRAAFDWADGARGTRHGATRPEFEKRVATTREFAPGPPYVRRVGTGLATRPRRRSGGADAHVEMAGRARGERVGAGRLRVREPGVGLERTHGGGGADRVRRERLPVVE